MAEMWQRTKRLINAYLDDLIERVNKPDQDVRAVTRAELSRLNEVEVQTRASAKMFEKEIAELELKITGLAERERLLRDNGDEAAAASAASAIEPLIAQRDMLRQQLSEANAAASRARALREVRKVEGESLATETHLTSMRENLSSLQTPFSSTDPAGTIEEMRSRVARSAGGNRNLDQADQELEKAKAQASVDDMLARYKQGIEVTAPAPPAPTTTTENSSSQDPQDESQPSGEKSLGRNEGPVRPID